MTGSIVINVPQGGEPRGQAENKIHTGMIQLREELNALLTSQNELDPARLPNEGISSAKLAAAARSPVTWYTPKAIATEESRESTSFGTLTTADEITGVVVPTNGLLLIAYSALWKGSVLKTANAAIFLGSNQLKMASASGGSPKGQEASLVENANFRPLMSTGGGLIGYGDSATDSSFVTTGQIVGVERSYISGNDPLGGFIAIRAAAGTYAVSVRFKATGSTVKVKERTLQVATLG